MPASPRLTIARACVWSDDGGLLALATDAGVVLWRLGRDLAVRGPGPAGDVDAVALVGSTLWSAGDSELRQVNVTSGALLQQRALTGTALALTGRVCVTRIGSTLALIGLDGAGEARQLPRPDVRPRRPLDDDDDEDDGPDWWELEQGRAVTCVAVAPDGCSLVAAYADGACWMFDLRAAAHRQLQGPGEPAITAIAWHAGGDRLVVAGEGRFVVYGAPAWRPERHTRSATGLFERVTAVVFSPRSSEFAVTSEYDAADGTVEDLEFIRVDDVAARDGRKFVQIREIEQRRHVPSACAAAFDPSGRVLAICRSFGGVSLWDSEARRFLGTLQSFAGRAAGMLAHEPRTVGEPGRIELVGDAAQLAAIGDDPYPPWTAACEVASGRGPLAEALARRLAGRGR